MPNLTDPNPTERQRQYLRAIKELNLEKGYPPTLDELSTYMGVAMGTAQDIMGKMKTKGFVTWEEGKPRTMSVLRGV